MTLKANTTLYFLLFCFAISCFAQTEEEILPPYNIKTVSFLQNGENMVPFFRLGDHFELQFDDLFGNEADYYYTITHCDYEWKTTPIAKNEYMQGFDDLRIKDYENSFNTLQLYSHYRLSIPNQQIQLKISGNYILKILDAEREVVFSKKFILYEDLVMVPLEVKRARDLNIINYKQSLNFAVNAPNLLFQNPIQNVKVALFQNGRWDDVIYNIKPQYTLGNDLVYKYDTETQFWAGNEFLYFDNKDIRGLGSNVSHVDSKEVYNTYLYGHEARANKSYSYNPDINGNFVVRNLNAVNNNEVDADYAWVYFTLSAPEYFEKKDIYITGMFNNYAKTPEYKLDYNADRGIYQKAIMIKQGFTNYEYTVYDNETDHKNAIDGNFYQTENDYYVLVYYKTNNERYDRVIGKGVANSKYITN